VPTRVLSVDVPCKGCRRSVCPLGHNRCLHAVEPEAIVDAVLDLAKETGMPGRSARTPTATPAAPDGGVPALAR
jgi:hypothetical protein